VPLDSPLVLAAASLARQAHAQQRRKAEGLPYFVHLEAVARLLFEHGHDHEPTLAAAYLHDLLEDQPAFEARLRAEQPAEVVRIVELVTEQKLDAAGNKRSKAARFSDYVLALSVDNPLTRCARAVSCADRIDNATSLVRAERAGCGLLVQLSTRPEEHALQLATLRPLYQTVVRPSLLDAFDRAADELERCVQSWVARKAL